MSSSRSSKAKKTFALIVVVGTLSVAVAACMSAKDGNLPGVTTSSATPPKFDVSKLNDDAVKIQLAVQELPLSVTGGAEASKAAEIAEQATKIRTIATAWTNGALGPLTPEGLTATEAATHLADTVDALATCVQQLSSSLKPEAHRLIEDSFIGVCRDESKAKTADLTAFNDAFAAAKASAH